MKILVIPQAYPDEDNKSLTPFIKENTVSLASLGHDVSVLNIRQRPLKQWLNNTHTIEQFKEDGILRLKKNVRFFHGLERYNTHAFYINTRKLFLKYWEEQGKPDLIVSHFYQYAGWAAVRISREFAIPLIHIEHAGWILKGISNTFEIEKLKCVLDNSCSFICVSKSLKDAICKATGTNNNIAVIPNMISDCFTYKPPIQKDKFVFFSAGNLYEGKRFSLLIEAFCSAFTKSDNVELRIAGSGYLEPKLTAMITEMNRKNQIVLLGALDKSHMLTEYTYCDCFVLPSEHETFGIVYREAMACGRPIITTNHQGFTNDWDDDYGLRIQIDNKEDLIKSLVEMRSNYKRYDGQLISNRCIAQYSSKNVISMYDNILKTIEV